MSLTPQCFPCCSVDGLLLLAVSFKGMDGLANIWPSGEVSLSSRGFLPACHVRMLIIAKKKKKKKRYEQGIFEVEICFLRPSDFSKAARLEKRIMDRVEMEGGDFKVSFAVIAILMFRILLKHPC